MAINEVIDVLKRARARLAVPGAWMKGCYARDTRGRMSLGWCPEDEVAWDPIGAIRAEAPELWNEASQALIRHLPDGLRMHEFNDACDDVAPVLDVFDRAIARLEAEASS